VASLGIHIVLLAVFGFVKFSRLSYGQSSAARSAVTISRIEQIAKQSRILSKPGIKRLSLNRKAGVHKKPMDFSVVAKIKPSDRWGKLPEPTGTDGIELLADSDIVTGKVEFFGQETNRRKICDVVSCSGSMQGLFGRVRKQLKNSIGNLEPDQYFYIILFRGDELLESGDGKLVRATAKTKSQAFDFIDKVRPGGKTNASGALERAMRMRGPSGQSAELIYFLTDGLDLEGADTARFGPLVESLRKRLAPTTKINTIGFWAQRADCEILQAVAKRNGGEFVNID